MTASVSPELDALDPQSRVITLAEGKQVEVAPLRTRQLLRLVRVLTKGATPMLASLSFDTEGSNEEFGIQLATTVAFALGEAEDEAMEFLQSLVEPIGLRKGRNLTKVDQSHNDALLDDLYEVLDNPLPQDTFAILQNVFVHEAENLKSLGKQIGVMLRASGATPEKTTSAKATQSKGRKTTQG